jgi:aminopeptidase YwaD
MKKKMIIGFIAAASIGINLHAQHFNAGSEKKLLKHIIFLADDKQEGRMTGSNGEMVSALYIAGVFKKSGAKPGNGDSYLQDFEFTESVEPTENTWFKVNGELWTGGKDYYPIDGTASGIVAADIFFAGFGIKAPELGYNDYEGKGDRKGKIFVIELGAPDGNTPHSKYIDYLKLDKKIALAKEEGAAAVIFINKGDEENDPSDELNPKVASYDMPVIFVKRNFDYLEADEVIIQVEITRKKGTGHNVLGFIDNKAATTIVIGAHYDHLGFGGSHSLYRGEPEVHNGADDNASGTSMLMELVSMLKKSKWKNNNYLFIAFSGEELGLYGSSFFTKSPLMDQYKVNYMLNMDMVGRLDPAENVLIVNGVGTSPVWKDVMKKVHFGGDTNVYKVKTTEGGIGPSDQTSFYFKDVPAIHFFSGTHNDYHKPSDDWQKINANGMRLIGDYLLNIVAELNDDGKIPFSKTQDNDGGKVSPFKVTLGVVPDYAYEGEGLRVDGVTDGKPASVAGIIAGDVIIKIGDIAIKDIYAYMGALGKFKKGDVVNVTLLRNKEQMVLQVKF